MLISISLLVRHIVKTNWSEFDNFGLLEMVPFYFFNHIYLNITQYSALLRMYSGILKSVANCRWLTFCQI